MYVVSNRMCFSLSKTRPIRRGLEEVSRSRKGKNSQPTVWKFQNFHISQFLREINLKSLEGARLLKTAFLPL